VLLKSALLTGALLKSAFRLRRDDDLNHSLRDDFP